LLIPQINAVSITQKLHEKISSLLRKELEECLQNLPFEKAVEKCFIVAGNYWTEVRQTMVEYGFETTNEEVFFFKTVKPLFTSEFEYYSLLYHSVLFCPADEENARKFWNREILRLEDFRQQNKCFVEYYESGKTCLDAVYYTRIKVNEPDYVEVDAYDREPKTRSSHDHLIAKLKAIERYVQFAQCKLNQL
jgi:hypothetical protein